MIKSSKWFVIFLISMLSILAFTKFITVVDKKHAEKAQSERVDGRFETISEFKIFDGSMNDKKGSVIKDKESGECYLYFLIGSGYWGGPTIIKTDKSECEEE